MAECGPDPSLWDTQNHPGIGTLRHPVHVDTQPGLELQLPCRAAQSPVKATPTEMGVQECV
jgi:hypothetical protein